MSDEPASCRVPRSVFISFVALLRANGFAVAPEQTTAFLAAIELLGPRSLEHIRQAGLATLAPPPERRATYDRLFDIHFRGSEAIERAEGEDEETSSACRRKDAARTSRRWPTKPTNPALPRRAPRRWSSAALRKPPPATRCAGCRARRRRGCRGGAAIGAGARGAGRSPTCAAPCARACATTAKCCGSGV